MIVALPVLGWIIVAILRNYFPTRTEMNAKLAEAKSSNSDAALTKVLEKMDEHHTSERELKTKEIEVLSDLATTLKGMKLKKATKPF